MNSCHFPSHQELSVFLPDTERSESIAGDWSPQGKEPGGRAPSAQPWGQAWTRTQAGQLAGSSHCATVLTRWQLGDPELMAQWQSGPGGQVLTLPVLPAQPFTTQSSLTGQADTKYAFT